MLFIKTYINIALQLTSTHMISHALKQKAVDALAFISICASIYWAFTFGLAHLVLWLEKQTFIINLFSL